ncbi:hypothetical protein ZWY2020_011639 [Hordeum vulgare]|nr:hypothetical protein ZWY2020_011639 [Hordeum vulgare]
MTTPSPLTQPSASPSGTSTSIPIADGGIPSLPSTTTEQQQSDATAGSTVIQVEVESEQQEARQTTGGTRYYLKGPIRYCLLCLFGTCYVLFKILSPCLKWTWNCVEFWTPISATFLVYWLIYRPDRFHPHTGSAVLAAFDLTDGATTLQYDLAVDLSFRNSHHLSIRYLDVAASLFYNGTRLGPTDDPLPRFIQRRKNTTVLHPAFHGAVTMDSGVAAELQRERAAGTVHLRITVSLTLVYKVLFVKDVFFYEYDCWLWFPPPRNHTPALFDGDDTIGARDVVYGNDESFMFKVVYFAFKMVLSYMVTWLSMLLLYGIYFRPYAVRPNVDAAALAAFDLSPGPGNNTMLHYDLALNVTFFNDHRIWAIRFNHFTARLYFNGTQVSPPDDTFPKFKGRLRRHRTVHPVLRGRASNVSVAVVEDFSCQRAQGWFAVQVKLRATLTYVIWPTWYVYYYEYDCWLHFPSNARPAVIGGVKCSKGKQFALS